MYRFKKDPKNRKKKIMSGIYKCCRNPAYFGNFLFWLGLSIVGNNLIGYIGPIANLFYFRFVALY